MSPFLTSWTHFPVFQPGASPLVSFHIEGVVAALKAARGTLARTADKSGRVLDLPSPRHIEAAISGLSNALFPRRFGGVRADSNGALDYFVGHTLGQALEGLQAQVVRELSFTASLSTDGIVDAEQTSRAIVQEFAERLPGILEILDSDVRAAYDGDPSAKSVDEVLLSLSGHQSDHPSPPRARALQARRCRSSRASSPSSRIRRPASTFIRARRSAAASSSTTAPASSSARRPSSASACACTRPSRSAPSASPSMKMAPW